MIVTLSFLLPAPNQSIKYPTTSPSPLFHVSWDVSRAGQHGLANLQSNSPWSTAHTPPPAPWATHPMSARGRVAGRCARRRGCRRGTVMPLSQHGRFSLPPPKGLCPFFLLDGQWGCWGGGPLGETYPMFNPVSMGREGQGQGHACGHQTSQSQPNLISSSS